MIKNSPHAVIGDTVSVVFNDGKRISGILQYIPSSSDDTWIVTAWSGKIYHIQNFQYITVDDRKYEIEDKKQ